MGNFKISCREQLVASAVAIHDWATDVGERQGIDWTLYDQCTGGPGVCTRGDHSGRRMKGCGTCTASSGAR